MKETRGRWDAPTFLDGGDGNRAHRALDSPRPSSSQDVKFVRDGSDAIIDGRHSRRNLLGVDPSSGTVARRHCSVMRRLAIIDGELGSQKV